MPISALKKEALDDISGGFNEGHEPESVGQILKRARAQSQESIESIAHTLRISQAYLSALENGETDKLPELVYTIGFLKTYATHLGLDHHEIVKSYKSQFIKIHRPEALDFPVPSPERHLPNRMLIIIALALACLIGLAWFYLQPWGAKEAARDMITPEVALEQGLGTKDLTAAPSETTSENEGPSPTAVLPAEASPVFPVSDTRSLKETKSATLSINEKSIFLGKGETLVIMASQPSWVEIKKGEETLLNQTLKPGDSKEITTEDGLVFSTGNAGGLSLYINNRYYAPLGRNGEVFASYHLIFDDMPTKSPAKS